MAKAGFSIDIEPFQHRDPVSGSTKTFMRNSHSRQSSPKVIAHKRCVAERMRGFKASGSNSRERSQSVRAAFTAATEGCRGAR